MPQDGAAPPQGAHHYREDGHVEGFSVPKFSCKDGKGGEMDAALRAIVAASESVDGVESYSYHRGEDGTYWFFAIMSSMEAAQRHGDNEAMQAAMPALMALLAGPPDMAMTTPVAANGFDF